MRLLHVDHVVQNRRTALSLAWHEWFSRKDRMKDLLHRARVVVRTSNMKISRRRLADYTKKRATRAARLFFFIQPIKSLICAVDVAVVKSLRELKQPRRRWQQKPHKFAYLTMKNGIFARAFFLLTF